MRQRFIYRLKDLSKSSQVCSLTPKNSWQRRQQQVSDTTRRLVSVSLSLMLFCFNVIAKVFKK